jgi:PAS domain S-box-containing protein
MKIIQDGETLTKLTQPELRRKITDLETLVADYEQREIERKELLTVEQAHRRNAEALYQASLALNSSLNYEEVLDRILEQARHLIPHDAASLMLVEGNIARMFRWRGYDQFITKGDTVSLNFNIAATPTFHTMQKTHRPLVIPYVEADKSWVAKPGQSWIKSYIGAPICIRGQVMGFINLNCTSPGFFGSADVEPLQAFTKLIATALMNARLYDQGRREVIQRVKALKQERNFISAVLDTAGALVMVLNRQGRIIRFNRACEQSTGYAFEEVKGKYWWDLFLPPAEVEPIKADFEKLWLDQQPSQYESYWTTKEGQQRLIAWSSTVLLDHKGAVEYILNTGIDLTERKQAEEALQSQQERFREVILSISDHVYVTEVTAEGHRLNRYISPHIDTLTGYPREKFETDWSFWPSQVIHPDDRAAAAAQAARLWQGQNSEMEYRLVRVNGEVIWVRDSARVQTDESTTLVYGVVSNITERKRVEEELKETNQQLQTLNQRLQKELNLAQKIQQSLLPASQPNWTGLDLVCHSVPAREVGGDFYTYHAFEDKGKVSRFAIAVGDVTGKGMPAALLMATSLTTLQSVITRTSDPTELLAELNLAIEPYTKTTLQNCALCCAEITPPSPVLERWLLRVANAGCITPLICRANGATEWVEVGGIPLGVSLSAKASYAEATLPLDKGDLVIFTSDGVIEATNAAGDMFDFERLEQAVAGGPRTSAGVMLAHLQAEVANFTGDTEPHDDLTIVIVQV